MIDMAEKDIITQQDGEYMKIHMSDKLRDIIAPKYPIWRKWRVKRKYGEHKAEYIDMLYTHEKSCFEYLPKIKIDSSQWNWNIRCKPVKLVDNISKIE